MKLSIKISHSILLVLLSTIYVVAQPKVTAFSIKQGGFNYVTGFTEGVSATAAEVPLNNFELTITFDKDVKMKNGSSNGIDTEIEGGIMYDLRDSGAASDLFRGSGGGNPSLNINDTDVSDLNGGKTIKINVRFIEDLTPGEDYVLSLVHTEVKQQGGLGEDVLPFVVTFKTAGGVSVTKGNPSAAKYCKGVAFPLNPIVLSESSEYTFVRNTSGKFRLQFGNTDFEFAGTVSDISATVFGDPNTTITGLAISADKKRLEIDYTISDNPGLLASIYITGIQAKYVGNVAGDVTANLRVVNDRAFTGTTRYFLNGLFPNGNSAGSVSLATVKVGDVINNTALDMTGKNISGPQQLCKNSTDNYTYFVPPITGAKNYYWKVPKAIFVDPSGGANDINGTFFSVTTTSNTLTLNVVNNATGSGNLQVRAIDGCERGTYTANYPVTINEVSVAFDKPVSIGNNTSYNITVTSPVGGSVTFSGEGMVGSRFYGTFFPANTLPKTVTINYTFTDTGNSGCVVSGSFDIDVFDAKANIKQVKSAYCTNDASTTFQVKQVLGTHEVVNAADVKIIPISPAGSAITPTYLGLSGGDMEFSFNPSSLGAGTYQVQAQSRNDTSNVAIQLYKADFTMNLAPSPTVNGTNTVCANTSATYSVLANKGHTYAWTLSGGGAPLSGSGSSFTVNWASDTLQQTYWVKVVETNPLTSCSTADSIQVTVRAQPNPKIVGDTLVCANSRRIYSVKNFSALHTYNWEVTGGVIVLKANDDSNITIDWAGTGSGTIKLTETDANGCSNSKTEIITLSALPIPTFKTGANNACVLKKDEFYEINLVGTNHEVLWQVVGGTIQGGAMSNDTSFVSGVELLSVTIDWGTGVQGKVIVTETNVTTKCKGILTKTVTLNPLPNLAFTGLTSQYCEDADVVTLSPTANGIAATGGTFIIRDSSNTNDIRVLGADNNSFDPKEIAQTFGKNTYQIVYQYTDAQGCEAISAPSSFIINSAPDGIQLNILREEGNRRVSFNATANNVQPSWSWGWRFSGSSSNTQNTILTLANAESQNITYSLDVRNELGCLFPISKVFNIDFSFSGKCLGSPTQFTDLTNLGGVAIESWNWDFGDGNTSTQQNPAHTYATPGTYYITLTVKESFVSYSLRKRIDIFPMLTVTPLSVYSEDFTSGAAGWISHGIVKSNGENIDSTSWQLKTPTSFINHIPADKGNAWVTDNSNNPNKTDTIANYNASEQSYVESPCFRINDLNRPMVSFDYWSDTDQGGDGVVLLYTIDDGVNWYRVGEQNQGLDWYDSKPILGKPGDSFSSDNGDGQGWSGNDQATTKVWKRARFGLDLVLQRMIAENVTDRVVRFRVAFGSNADNNPKAKYDGFAFDNFQITNRNRLVLMEYFINQSVANAATLDANTQAYANSKAEAISIHYHTAFPGNDEINNQSPKDPSGRAFHYGIRAVPRPTLDGEVRDEPILGDYKNTWVDTAFAQRTLRAAPFLINIAQPVASNGTLTVSATVNAIVALDRKVVMHIAVIEDTVNIGGNNYYNAVRKMLPDAAGTYRAQFWTAGSSQTLNETWDYSGINGMDPKRLRVVVFVADYETKEIYQAEVTDVQVNRRGNGVNDNNQVTGIENELKTNNWSLFPNPAANQLHIALPTTSLTEALQWEVITVSGQTVKQGTWARGSRQWSLKVSDLAAGVYIIKLSNSRFTSQRRFEKH